MFNGSRAAFQEVKFKRNMFTHEKAMLGWCLDTRVSQEEVFTQPNLCFLSKVCTDLEMTNNATHLVDGSVCGLPDGGRSMSNEV